MLLKASQPELWQIIALMTSPDTKIDLVKDGWANFADKNHLIITQKPVPARDYTLIKYARCKVTNIEPLDFDYIRIYVDTEMTLRPCTDDDFKGYDEWIKESVDAI